MTLIKTSVLSQAAFFALAISPLIGQVESAPVPTVKDISAFHEKMGRKEVNYFPPHRQSYAEYHTPTQHGIELGPYTQYGIESTRTNVHDGKGEKKTGHTDYYPGKVDFNTYPRAISTDHHKAKIESVTHPRVISTDHHLGEKASDTLSDFVFTGVVGGEETNGGKKTQGGNKAQGGKESQGGKKFLVNF